MPEIAKKYGILIGVDGSAESDAAIRWAARDAVTRDAPITLMHVIEPVPDWPTPDRQAEIAEAWEQNARDVIEQARKTAQAAVRPSDCPQVDTEVVHSPVVPMLIGASRRAQMIVVGSRGWVRSAASCSGQSAPVSCTMLTVRSQSSTPMKASATTTRRFWWA